MQNDANPYQPTFIESAPDSFVLGSIPAADLKKIEAVVKDAGQFWLAIILCILCSSIGGLLIAPWYGSRLLQWSRLAQAYPQLLATDSPPRSLQSRFRSAKIKLIVGVVFGLLMLCAGIAFITLTLMLGSSFQQTM